MTSGQGELFLLLILCILVTIAFVMLGMALSRLPKQKQHSLKNSLFYFMLPSLIGGQILIRSGLHEKTGIIDDIKKENNRISFSCPWTAERENGSSKWSPCVNPWIGGYLNFFEKGILFNIDESSIFVLKNNSFCVVLEMEGGQGVAFLYPKSEGIIKLEDVDDYKVMLPITAKV